MLSKHGSRLAIRPFTSPRGFGTVYFVHDADWILDSEVKADKTSPVVGCFDTLDDAEEYCRRVIKDGVATIPHDSAFLGWPELRERIKRRLTGRN